MTPTFQRLARGTLAAAALATCLNAVADGPDRRNLTSEWWQWILSIPAAANPLLDDSGKNCMVGQRGDTWFLAGSFGGAATRACSVPEGVTLFVPAANSINFESPDVCGEGKQSVAQLRAKSAAFIDSLTQTIITIDSRPVKTRRIRSEVFPLALPVDNVFNSPGCVVPDKIYPRAVDDGVYAAIEGLSPGNHTLQITASNGTNFDLSITYTLNVVPRDRR